MMFFTAATWDELRQIASERWSLLAAPAGDAIVKAMEHALAHDAYGLAYVAQRRELLEQCRRLGVDAVFAGPPRPLKEAPRSMQMLAKMSGVRSRDQIEGVAHEIAQMFPTEVRRK